MHRASLILSLLTACLLTLGFPARALAEAHLLPSGPVIGDGVTPSMIRVWIPDLSAEETLRVRADQGRCGEPVSSPGGFATFSFLPPRVVTPTAIPVTLQRRGAQYLEESFEIPLAPPFEGRITLTTDLPSLMIGTGTAQVKLTPTSTTPQANANRRFLLTASVGTVEQPVFMGDGTWLARYVPPAELTGPRIAIITAVDAAAPDEIFGWTTLQLKVTRSVTFEVDPDAEVTLKVGERLYGPAQASPIGTLAFPVELDPLITSGRLQTITKTGVKKGKNIELPVAAYGRLTLLALPPTLPAEPSQIALPVRIIAIDEEGRPSKVAPTIQSTAGQVSKPIPTPEPGVFLAVFTPPAAPGTATILAEIGGFKAEGSIRLIAPLPRLDLSVDPEELPKNKSDFTVTVRVKDSGGTALTGRKPLLIIPQAKVIRALADKRDGVYTAVYRLNPQESRATILALPDSRTSDLSPCRLLLWPRSPSGPADGYSRVPVTLAAVDRFGLPVANATITLAIPRGDASLPPEIKTNAQGLATVEMRLGKAPGLVILRATSNGLETETPFFQVEPGKASAGPIAGGESASLAALASWQGAIATATIRKAGVVASARPPSDLTLSSIPPYTTPGAGILLTLRVMDSEGNPLPRTKPTIKSSVGRVGALSNNGDGTFSAPIQLPLGVDGPMTVTVTVQELTRTLTLPTFASTLQAPPAEVPAARAPSRASSPPAPAEAPAQEITVQNPPSERAQGSYKAGGAPHLRLGADLDIYQKNTFEGMDLEYSGFSPRPLRVVLGARFGRHVEAGSSLGLSWRTHLLNGESSSTRTLVFGPYVDGIYPLGQEFEVAGGLRLLARWSSASVSLFETENDSIHAGVFGVGLGLTGRWFMAPGASIEAYLRFLPLGSFAAEEQEASDWGTTTLGLGFALWRGAR